MPLQILGGCLIDVPAVKINRCQGELVLKQDGIVKPKKTRKIGLVGTFDVANYGDCLFPYVYMHLLQERMSAAEFSVYSPMAQSAGIMDYGPIRPLPSKLTSVDFPEDALILCGGETIWLGHSAGTFNFPASTLSAYARLWLAPTVAASQGTTDFYVHSVGMPNVHQDAPDQIGEALSYATAVSVRDAVTAARLGGRFPVEVDPVFALSTLMTSPEWEAEALKWLPDNYEIGRYIVAHISAPYLINDLGEWCDQVVQTAKQTAVPVLLVPICHFMDDRRTLQTARELLIRKGLDENQIQLAPLDSKDIISTAAMLGMSAGVITSSLHACVTAVSFGLPFAGYVGKGKAEGKHRQTLMAAGIDFGMAMTIREICDKFSESIAQDRENNRKAAITAALEAFDSLAKSLERQKGLTKSLSQDTVEKLLLLDLAPTKNWKAEFKRTVLRWVRKSDVCAEILNVRLQARVRRSIL